MRKSLVRNIIREEINKVANETDSTLKPSNGTYLTCGMDDGFSIHGIFFHSPDDYNKLNLSSTYQAKEIFPNGYIRVDRMFYIDRGYFEDELDGKIPTEDLYFIRILPYEIGKNLMENCKSIEELTKECQKLNNKRKKMCGILDSTLKSSSKALTK